MAGAGIKAIKTRMGTVESTKQITKAMELVASSKLRKAKEKAEDSREYFNTLYNTVKDIAQTTRGIRNEFLKEREVKNKCYVVVAGDRGLAGGYNSNVLKESVSHMKGKKETVITVGKKAHEFFSKRNYNIAKDINSVEACGYEDATEISQTIIDLYKKGEVDEVYKVQYIPSAEAVLSYIVPQFISGTVYGGILESFASEQGARRTAMESATDNANEMLSNLELSYNRARQSAVTQEITEIVGGVEALK